MSKKEKVVVYCGCGAKLDPKGLCPALCTPIIGPQPRYTGPIVAGQRTHLGKLGKPVA